MSNFIQKGISISKVLLLIFTFVIGLSLSSQAQLLEEDPNPSAEASEEVSANFIGTLLWDQFGATMNAGTASQRFPDFSNSVLQSADDFVVPMGQTWSIEEVLARGSFGASGPIPSVDVIFYDDNSGMPGNVIGACNYMALAPANGADPNISVLLSTPCLLGPGHYWVSVIPVMPFNTNGQWFWSSVNFINLNEWQFQDPDGLIPNPCVTWGAGDTDCGAGLSNSDKQFQLLGELVVPIELGQITPGVKNSINAIEATGATPGGNVAFLGAFRRGSVIFEGPVCNGIELGINPFVILGIETANGDGDAQFILFVPGLGDISLVFTQAIDLDSCNVSDVTENILIND